MTTFLYILTYALGIATMRILSYYFSKPTNQYLGKVKIRQKGENNHMSVEIETYINGTSKRQFRKDKRRIKKELKNNS